LIRPFRCGKSSGKEKRRGGISRQANLGKGEQWADENFSPSQGSPSSTKRPHEGGDHKERATERKARRELVFAKQHRDINCDVCGPNEEHTFYACHKAAEEAIKAFLCFHYHEPEETQDPKRFAETHDLKHLVTLAAADLSTFESCMDAAIALTRGGSPNREPSRSELDDALRLTEQLVSFVESVFA
jgi:HEPN domain-containing protein